MHGKFRNRYSRICARIAQLFPRVSYHTIFLDSARFDMNTLESGANQAQPVKIFVCNFRLKCKSLEGISLSLVSCYAEKPAQSGTSKSRHPSHFCVFYECALPSYPCIYLFMYYARQLPQPFCHSNFPPSIFYHSLSHSPKHRGIHSKSLPHVLDSQRTGAIAAAQDRCLYVW